MNIFTRRIAAVIALSAAPALIAIGAAATSSADTGATNHGSSASHPAFPHQDNVPQPGTSVHHHHQAHRG